LTKCLIFTKYPLFHSCWTLCSKRNYMQIYFGTIPLEHSEIFPKIKCYLGPSWSWSYCSWIYNYLCNQFLSPLKLSVRTPFMTRCTRYNNMWWLSVSCGRSVESKRSVLSLPFKWSSIFVAILNHSRTIMDSIYSFHNNSRFNIRCYRYGNSIHNRGRFNTTYWQFGSSSVHTHRWFKVYHHHHHLIKMLVVLAMILLTYCLLGVKYQSLTRVYSSSVHIIISSQVRCRQRENVICKNNISLGIFPRRVCLWELSE
jgi:hypothetical protein